MPESEESLQKRGKKIYQIHLSRFCNYNCLHCYSSSSPINRQFINIDLVEKSIKDATVLGYDTVSLSGGEPMLYPQLDRLLSFAKNLNMITSLITNGSFQESAYEKIKGLVDIIGVSVDGTEDLHNRIRSKSNAFKKIDNFLDFANKYFNKVGIVFALSDLSWQMIPDILKYGQQKKVNLVQIHPLEMVGRAKNSKLASLSSANLKRAYLLTQAISCSYPFRIQFDAFTKYTANEQIVPVLTSKLASECIDLIVLDDNGNIIPFTYGFPKEWTIANIYNNDLIEGWNQFREDIHAFHKYCRESIENVEELMFAPGYPFMP